jgi:DNA mismatch repair protein MutS2
MESSPNRKNIQDLRLGLQADIQKTTKELLIESKLEAQVIAEAQFKEPIEDRPERPKNGYQKGDLVFVKKFKNNGTILEINGTELLVSMGLMKVKLQEAEVELKNKPKQKIEVRVDANVVGEQSSTLDLRGMRFEEAMMLLERYVEGMYSTKAFPSITIVHGIGTGALRDGTIAYLSKISYVKNFHDGGKGAGGTGATIVEFDWI